MSNLYVKLNLTEATLSKIVNGPWFDAEWYSNCYPDVKLTKLDPLYHYLSVGERLGRKASDYFDAAYYLECYPDVANASISPLVHFLRHGEKEGRAPSRCLAREIEVQLWRREEIAQCLVKLEKLMRSQSALEVSYASWVLAQWYAWKGDWLLCVECMEICHEYFSMPPMTPATYLLYIEALSQCNRCEEALIFYENLRLAFPEYLDAHLVFSNILASKWTSETIGYIQKQQSYDAQRIKCINEIYDYANMMRIVWDQIDQPLELEALVSKKLVPHRGHKKGNVVVSVIVPVYNAEAYLATALYSLAAQTLKKFEVLIVDDASTDGSLAVAEYFSLHDKRFRVVHQAYNQGAYAARNRGLREARGKYITVHDSDDYSHPEKLYCQVASLEAHPEWLANTSDMVRCTTSMVFGRWRIPQGGGWIYRNTSSLMMRREVTDTLGYWDRVRCSADTEYLHRIITAYGKQAYGEVMKGIPLAFCRHHHESLSQAGPMHLITRHKGMRYTYMEAAKKWHAQANSASDLYMSDHPSKRHFSAPENNLYQ